MKIIALNGSSRRDGNTFLAINIIIDELKKEGIESELIHLGIETIKNCDACEKCKKTKDGFCSIKSDPFNEYLAKIYESEGIIIGSPTYFGSVTPQTKAFIDRTGYCARAGGYKLKRKVAAGIAIARRAGAVNVCNQINNLFLLNQCIVPSSIYWNIGFGREKGEVLNDSEGVETFKILGQNMAWLLKKLYY